MSILVIHPGAYYHIESFEGSRYAHYFDKLVRPEELADVRLEDFNVVLIPCRTPADRMEPHKARLHAYFDQGGTIIATGESDSQLFLPGITFTPQPTNFWWWLTPGADLGVRIAKPGHSLFRHLAEKMSPGICMAGSTFPRVPRCWPQAIPANLSSTSTRSPPGGG